jgi:hypothetical protein
MEPRADRLGRRLPRGSESNPVEGCCPSNTPNHRPVPPPLPIIDLPVAAEHQRALAVQRKDNIKPQPTPPSQKRDACCQASRTIIGRAI